MTKTIITSALALAFLAGTAMAQQPTAPAPVVPATGNPAKAVFIFEAAQGLVEMCTDYAGKAEIPFTEDKVKKYFPEDKTKRLGIVLRAEHGKYIVRATTTSGVMIASILPYGACIIRPAYVNKTIFGSAFSSAFYNSSGYVRDARLPLREGLWWRGPKVLAGMGEVNPSMVWILPAPDRR